MNEQQKDQKREESEVKTFPVPFSLGKNQKNISVNTNTHSKPSKEQTIHQAFKFHSQGNISEAAVYYQHFINEGFKDQKVFTNYGVILKNLGKPQQAEYYYRKAIEIDPDYADAHYNLGIILKDLGKLQDAEFSYRKAIELNPYFAQSHCNLGNILKDLGNLQDAEFSYRKAIEIKPNFAEVHYNLGNILRDLGKLHEAELSTRKAIELNPDYANAYLNLGNILVDLGKEKDAIKHYSFALEKEPNDIYFHINSKFYFTKIIKNNSQINIERKNYQEQIQLLKDKKNIEYKNDEVFNTNIFYLPYHNRSDDKIILEELSNTLSKIKGLVVNNLSMDKKINSNSTNDHIKVGICSEFLRYSHVVGKLYLKVILDLLKTDL